MLKLVSSDNRGKHFKTLDVRLNHFHKWKCCVIECMISRFKFLLDKIDELNIHFRLWWCEHLIFKILFIWFYRNIKGLRLLVRIRICGKDSFPLQNFWFYNYKMALCKKWWFLFHVNFWINCMNYINLAMCNKIVMQLLTICS